MGGGIKMPKGSDLYSSYHAHSKEFSCSHLSLFSPCAVQRPWGTRTDMSKDGVVLGFFPRSHGAGISWSSGLNWPARIFKGVGRSFHRRACLWGVFLHCICLIPTPNKFFKLHAFHNNVLSIFEYLRDNFKYFGVSLNDFSKTICYTPLLESTALQGVNR